MPSNPASLPAAKRNSGWFRPGDRRINRQGRPRGARKAAAQQAIPPADLAPQTDRLKLFVRPARWLAFRISREHGPWAVNLPHPDRFEMVACRLDPARGVVFVLRSPTFAMVAAGAAIPELPPEWWGMKWVRY